MKNTTITCPAVLNIKGEHFACDALLDENGQHIGWAHGNSDAEAIWSTEAPVPA